MSIQEDWTKFVTLNPPNEVKFKLHDKDKTRLSQTEGTPESVEFKAIANIQIINKSKTAILYKVKTTQIQNYMVKPNAEVIPSQHSFTVKIQTQNPITEKSKKLGSDRFLVQLTKFEGVVPEGTLQADDIRKMWDEAQGKSKVVSYKLKVDLQPEIFEALEQKGGEVGSAPAIQPAVESKSSAPIQDVQQRELFTSFKGNVNDMMIDKTIEKQNQTPQSVEESKEKPEPNMSRNKYPPAHQAKLSMEEIKETKAENEDIQSQSTQGHFNQNEQAAATPASAPKAPASQGPSMKKRLDDAQAKKMKLQTQLKRLEDNKGVLGKKNNAMNDGVGYSGAAESSDGFKMHHLIALSVLGLLIGAYAEIYYLSGNPRALLSEQLSADSAITRDIPSAASTKVEENLATNEEHSWKSTADGKADS